MINAKYSIDTNAVLTAWRETYRPESFPKFWDNFSTLLGDGHAVFSEEVKREIDAKDDDVCDWVKTHSAAVVSMELEQITHAKALAKQFPFLAKERLGRMRADGFVIALALWKGLTVVTAENRRGREKIPNICKQVNVECISLADMIQRENWRF